MQIISLTIGVIGRVAIVIQSLMSVELPLLDAVASLQCPLYSVMFKRAVRRRPPRSGSRPARVVRGSTQR